MAGREHLALDPGYDLFRGYQYTSATEINACLPRADCPSWAQRNLRQALGELRAAKIFLFVLHRDLLGPDSTLPAICRTLLGEPFFADDQLEIFRLAPDA